MPDWKSIREDFDLDPESIYLNTGFIGSPPRVVNDTLQKYSARINRRPFRMLTGKTYSKLQATLAQAAKFINADPIEENTGPDRWEVPFRGEVGLTSSTTQGLFLVTNGLPIKDGREVLMTDQEYFTSELQWYYREQRENRKLVRKEPFFTDHSQITSDDILNWYREKITPNTQVVTYPHIFYHSGLVMPVKEISALLGEINRNRSESEKIISLVDGVQALGVLPLDIKDLGCDFYAAGCHKWLCGPRGTGILFGKKHLYERLVPSLQSFIMSFSGLLRDQERRERGLVNLRGPYAIMPGGTRSFESDWALAEAFAYQENIGKAAIETRIRFLRQTLTEELKQLDRLRIASPEDGKLSAGIVSFQVEGMEAKELWKALLRREVVTRPVENPNQELLRMCTHIYNSEQELEQTLEALREVLG